MAGIISITILLQVRGYDRFPTSEKVGMKYKSTKNRRIQQIAFRNKKCVFACFG